MLTLSFSQALNAVHIGSYTLEKRSGRLTIKKVKGNTYKITWPHGNKGIAYLVKANSLENFEILKRQNPQRKINYYYQKNKNKRMVQKARIHHYFEIEVPKSSKQIKKNIEQGYHYLIIAVRENTYKDFSLKENLKELFNYVFKSIFIDGTYFNTICERLSSIENRSTALIVLEEKDFFQPSCRNCFGLFGCL